MFKFFFFHTRYSSSRLINCQWNGLQNKKNPLTQLFVSNFSTEKAKSPATIQSIRIWSDFCVRPLLKTRSSRLFATKSQSSDNDSFSSDDCRPIEPDNCCMSGCAVCVWDTYYEEIEEWTIRKKNKAVENARNQDKNNPCHKLIQADTLIEGETKNNGEVLERGYDTENSIYSVDSKAINQVKDDTFRKNLEYSENASGIKEPSEVGKEINFQGHDDDAVLAHVPIEIREFMKMERRLKAKKNDK